MLGTNEVVPRREFAEAAVREARMAEDPAALATALLALCWGLSAAEDLPARGVELLRRRTLQPPTPTTSTSSSALCSVSSSSHLSLVIPRAARRAAADFDSITERCPLPYHRWNAYLFNATLALIAGDVDRAQFFADQIDPPSTGQPVQAEVMRSALRGHISAQRGGQAAVDGARVLCDDIQRYIGAGWLFRPRVAVDSDVEAARDLLADAMDRLLASPVDEDRLAFLSMLAEAAILSGAKESAPPSSRLCCGSPAIGWWSRTAPAAVAPLPLSWPVRHALRG